LSLSKNGATLTRIRLDYSSNVIPYGRQDITQADIDSVVSVLRSDFLTQGSAVPAFERAVAQYCGVKNGVAVSSATSALHLACIALELGPGDWLWTSPNSFVASANCAKYCGAKVDFVDIDPETYNMCVEALASKLKVAEAMGMLPKIVVPVHFAGQPCNMSAIHKLSIHYGFKIIEDASHAIGASYYAGNIVDGVFDNPIIVGACAHSDITVFSFHPVKIITTGEGGMVMTNSEIYADRIRRLRSHGITTDVSIMSPRVEGEIWNYQQVELGFNYRMTDIQAALGISQLQRLDDFVESRKKLSDRYESLLEDLPLKTPYIVEGFNSSWHLYVIRLMTKKIRNSHKEVYQKMLENGIGVNLHYIPIHMQPYYQRMGFRVGDYPNAEEYFSQAITLPIFPRLKKFEHELVVDELRRAINGD